MITFALFGRGNVRSKPVDVPAGPRTGCDTVKYRIKVPGNSTRYLLFFTRMHADNDTAIGAASQFNSPGAALLTDIGQGARNRVLNWSL